MHDKFLKMLQKFKIYLVENQPCGQNRTPDTEETASGADYGSRDA